MAAHNKIYGKSRGIPTGCRGFVMPSERRNEHNGCLSCGAYPCDFTVMSNHHLRDKRLTLKAKGLLSMMLSLPEDWNYSTLGLAAICREGVDAIRGALRELEKEGYVIRRQLRGPGGQIQDIEYLIYEQPPGTGSPGTGNPGTVRPCPEKSAESNMDRSSTE